MYVEYVSVRGEQKRLPLDSIIYILRNQIGYLSYFMTEDGKNDNNSPIPFSTCELPVSEDMSVYDQLVKHSRICPGSKSGKEISYCLEMLRLLMFGYLRTRNGFYFITGDTVTGLEDRHLRAWYALTNGARLMLEDEIREEMAEIEREKVM